MTSTKITRKRLPASVFVNDGTWTKGRKKTAGRPPGQQNKISMHLKDAIRIALDLCGEDGKGKNGAIGFFLSLARYDKVLMVRLVEKIIPQQTQLTGKDGGPVQIFTLPDEVMKKLGTSELEVMQRVLTMIGAQQNVIEHMSDEVDESDYVEVSGVSH